jgi:hypothetical protein
MTLGGIAELLFGVRAEGKSLEAIAEPLSTAAPGDEQAAAAREDRIGRRHDRETAGLRRYRPGLGSSFYSPGMVPGGTPADSSGASDRQLDFEIDTLGETLAGQGPLERAELARRVGARYWGPGRFRVALRECVRDDRARRAARRAARRTYEATAGPRDAGRGRG